MSQPDQDRIVRYLIIFILGAATGVIYAAASTVDRAASRPLQEDWRPEIPECNEELWTRIKDKCNGH